MKTWRQERLATTMEFYTHRVSKKQKPAQDLYLTAIGKATNQ
jgi:hypothetical protein